MSNSPSQPLIFDDFFEQGLQEELSPFLTSNSRKWANNLTLKAAILSAGLLLICFILSFSPSTIPISNFLLISVYFIVGIPALIESIEELFEFDINIDILMTLAAFSSVLIGSGMEGALLLVLFALSGSMEEAVTSRAKNAISTLHKLSPSKATVVESDGTIIERSVKEIPIGTSILVKSGQIVPLDGLVIEGISSVNLVHLTGENFPVTKRVEDEVPAGARNLEGALVLKVLRSSSNSTIAKIIELVTQAQESRPQLQRWFDKLSRKYAITIILLSTFFALILPWVLDIPYLGVEGSVYRGLAFLIAASPCALIIAIPIAYLSALSACARKGIILKGGVVLDRLASCTAIALDKTGTLTTGDLTCEAIKPLESASAEEQQQAISIAYSLEKNAVHPIAKAIVDFAQTRKILPLPLQNFKAFPGQGLEAFYEQTQVSIGQLEFISEKLPLEQGDQLKQKAEVIKEQGKLLTVLLVGTKIYLIEFRDTVRPQIKETLVDLQQKAQVELIMLTGDHERSARKIATELGIERFYADLRPGDKLDYINQLSKEQKLAMVGDGINDAPALARANVGICMGKVGSTAAIDAADIVLLNDNIENLYWLMKKARQTQSIVKQNLIIAVAAIVIASLPALGGYVPLWLAVVMHEGGTVLVGLNGLRLLASSHAPARHAPARHAPS
jgi:Zn2+/Cd2+-exporting ATPase